MNFLVTLRLRTRLGGGFALLAAIVVGIGIVSVVALGRADHQFERFVGGINARMTLASQLRTAVDVRAISARNLVLVTTREDAESEKALVVKAHAEVQERLGRLKEAAKAPDVSERARELIAEIDKVEQVYGPVALDIVAAASAGRKEEAIAAMNAKCRPLLARLVTATDTYMTFSAGVSAKLVQASNEQYVFQRDVIVAIALGSVALAMLAAWTLTNSITRPVAQAVAVAEAVAAGDLTVRRLSGGKDEIGCLLSALSDMSAGLATIVLQVRGSSESVATGASEIATGNLDLSQRTEEQASALQQTAATMEQRKRGLKAALTQAI